MAAYSLQALVEASGMTEAALTRHVRMSGTALKRARSDGLTEEQADRFASRLGLHPSAVWDQWVSDVIDAESIACEGCDDRFVPWRSTQRFCTPACRKRAADRRSARRRRLARPGQDAAYRDAYRSDERVRETMRRQRRAYYWRNRDRELARQREYDRTVRAVRRQDGLPSGCPQTTDGIVAA